MIYKLFNPNSGEEIIGVTIDESAKKDFKDMMGWDEIQWNYHTDPITNRSEE